MCNLYSMTAPVAAMRDLVGGFEGDRSNLPPFAEIYPDHEAPILWHGAAANGLKLDLMRWGFPPPGDVKRPVTNVRNLLSPFWRTALSRPDRRCLVPATAFAEWSAEPDPASGRKRKHWFALKGAGPDGPEGHPLFAFAGLWRPTPEGARYAFLTCAPNETVGRVHPKAMPVLLTGEACQNWLRAPVEDALTLAVPYADERMVELGASA